MCVHTCKARSHIGLDAPRTPQLTQREISVGILCDPQGWHWAIGESGVRGVKCYQGKCKLSLTTGAESMFSVTPGPLIFHKVIRNMAAATPGRVLIRLFKEVWNKHTQKHTVSCCYLMDSLHGFAWKVTTLIFFLAWLASLLPGSHTTDRLLLWTENWPSEVTLRNSTKLSNTHPGNVRRSSESGCALQNFSPT